jgi:hypothetical protein
LDAVKLWSSVRWWERLLISFAVILPAVLLTEGRPFWQMLLAVAPAAAVGELFTSWLNQRRRLRAYEEVERRERTHTR